MVNECPYDPHKVISVPILIDVHIDLLLYRGTRQPPSTPRTSEDVSEIARLKEFAWRSVHTALVPGNSCRSGARGVCVEFL
jgi:hypothetical protein